MDNPVKMDNPVNPVPKPNLGEFLAEMKLILDIMDRIGAGDDVRKATRLVSIVVILSKLHNAPKDKIMNAVSHHWDTCPIGDEGLKLIRNFLKGR